MQRLPQDNRKVLLQYAGLSAEVCISVGLSIFVGLKADKWLRVSLPLFACGLPLLVITALIVKLIKGSAKQRDEK
jgi:hypothetical protein